MATVITTIITIVANIDWAKLTLWHSLGALESLSRNPHILLVLHLNLTHFLEAGRTSIIFHFKDKNSSTLKLKDTFKVTLLSRLDTSVHVVCLPAR